MVESIRDLGIWWTFDKGIGSCTGGAEIYCVFRGMPISVPN